MKSIPLFLLLTAVFTLIPAQANADESAWTPVESIAIPSDMVMWRYAKPLKLSTGVDVQVNVSCRHEQLLLQVMSSTFNDNVAKKDLEVNAVAVNTTYTARVQSGIGILQALQPNADWISRKELTFTVPNADKDTFVLDTSFFVTHPYKVALAQLCGPFTVEGVPNGE
jgi:hypothetical protein